MDVPHGEQHVPLDAYTEILILSRLSAARAKDGETTYPTAITCIFAVERGCRIRVGGEEGEEGLVHVVVS